MWHKLNQVCQQTDKHAVCETAKNRWVAYDRLKTGGFQKFGVYDNERDAKRMCEGRK